MPTFKTVWQFVESSGATFSEIWYKDANTIASVVDPKSPSVVLRSTFLHPLNRFIRIRVSQVGLLRNTLNVLINQVGSSGATGGPLPVGCAMVIQIAGQGGGSRKWWMRGNANGDYQRNPTTGIDQPSDGFNKQIQFMLQNLATDQYGILRQTPLANPVVANPKITSVDGMATPGQSVLACATPAGVAVGSTVVISRVPQKTLPRLQGRFTVLATTAATITINYATPGNKVYPINSGNVKLLVFDPTHLVDPTKSGFDHLGTRTSKNPLSSSRGAKRASRLRNLA